MYSSEEIREMNEKLEILEHLLLSWDCTDLTGTPFEKVSKEYVENQIREIKGHKRRYKKQRICPKAGDLIELPSGASALVLDVWGSKKAQKSVYRVLSRSRTFWLDRKYVEYECILLS